MSEAQFSIVFRGPAVDNGEIDVNDLAPALLAVGDLIQSANGAINGESARVAVRVRATASACFEVDLTLYQSVLEYAKAFLDFAADHQEGIAAANELSDLIFKVGTPVAVGASGGLLLLLKWLRGRKPQRIDKEGDTVTVHISGNTFVTNVNTITLAENIAVRQNAQRLVSILNREGIDSLSAKQAGQEGVTISRDDVSSFDLPEDEEEELEDETREMTLQIISLSFKDDNKWRLTDGGEPFSAAIEDVNFLNKIARSEVSFSKNDYLVCRVRERQVRTAKGLKKERVIIEVLDHKPAARQLRLL